MFVAVTTLPEQPAALAEAAVLCGLTPMEVRARCAGVLPRVLVRQASAPDAERIKAGLEALCFRAFAAAVEDVPTDAQRIVARQLAWTDTGFTVLEASGACHDCFFPTLSLFQLGFRATTHAEVVKSTERKFSMGRALATGGLSLSKTVETVRNEVTIQRDSFLLVNRTDGLPAIMLYESRLDFQCLGSGLQHTRAGNLKALLERLRVLAAVPVDDLTMQQTFLRGVPQIGVDEVDLGLFLIRTAQAVSA